MGKIWLKTRYDNEMQMEIPHNWNFANAMYGFRELGAEIVPYHTIDEIYDQFQREDIALDYLDQCRNLFSKFGVNAEIPDYPQSLQKYMGRKIWKDSMNAFASDENKWSKGYFVKPVKDKAFTGKIISSIKDLVGCGSCYEDYEIIVSEPLDILAEWRGFIYYDELLDMRPYGSVNKNYEGYKDHYNYSVVEAMMESFRSWDERPAACSMDVCYTKDGRTLLVECNDAYSLGCYGLPSLWYAKFISARWSQLLGVDDQYHF